MITARTYVRRASPGARHKIAATVLLLGAGFLMAQTMSSMRSTIYWGALIKGATYGLSDAPWDTQTIDLFESHTGKKVSILHWGQSWWDCYVTCGYQPFQYQRPQYDAVRQRGMIPLVDWASWDLTVKQTVEQPRFTLRSIINGDHDAYIRQWATEARDWGYPFFLRFNWEMNGSWYPWSEQANGNQSGEYVAAWRHVRTIFRDVGAVNVTWVWCPVTLYPGSLPLEELYPGDNYVDWTCMDGYNWGTNPARPDEWKSFTDVFLPTYERLLTIAPNKPVMIAEFASTEYGGSKAQWIESALTRELPSAFQQVKALIWFNWNTEGMDWVIESSPAAQQAFAKSIASSYYATNEWRRLRTAPIPPIDELSWSEQIARFFTR